jgi:hypothetical protein
MQHIDESKKFDKRTIARNLKEGIVPTKEWEALLKKLPDVSDKADVAVIQEDGQRRGERAEKGEKGESKTPAGKGGQSEEEE